MEWRRQKEKYFKAVFGKKQQLYYYKLCNYYYTVIGNKVNKYAVFGVCDVGRGVWF
jgi:hypothetical protein